MDDGQMIKKTQVAKKREDFLRGKKRGNIFKNRNKVVSVKTIKLLTIPDFPRKGKGEVL